LFRVAEGSRQLRAVLLVCTGDACCIATLGGCEVVYALGFWAGEKETWDGVWATLVVAVTEAEAEVADHQPVV
jgi:hypothetical protein